LEIGSISSQKRVKAREETTHGRKATKNDWMCGARRSAAVRPQKSQGRVAISAKTGA
jgi:hypothetical protein